MEMLKTLLAEFRDTRQRTERLCAPLRVEDHVAQPMGDVSPPKWHLGHTTWFFENFVLSRFAEGYRLHDQRYNYCFNSYYESQGGRVLRVKRGDMTRPTVEEAYAYRRHVDERMGALLEDCASGRLPEADRAAIESLVELGCHHEQQHQELLVTDLKYVLAMQYPIYPAYLPKPEGFEARFPANGHASDRYVEVGEGLYRLGFEGEGFHFDNEEGAHQVFLHPFRFMDRLVTAGEYLEFVQAGGYRDFRFWLSEGWEWVKANGIQAPLYWNDEGGVWYQYTLFGYEQVDLHAPVTHVSYYEADAYARWKGKRLLTEAEWETACKQTAPAAPESANFLDSGNWQPVKRRPGDAQLAGDCWEWTGSAYLPYPYYKQDEGALGEYNGKFMVNQMVLRGGSCATPRGHYRLTYRNFFHADKRWQFSGIRLAESL